MKRTSEDYLGDILRAALRAQSFVEGMSFESFEQDTKTQFAVIRALEIIGEATKRVSETHRDEIDGLPWRQMAGMRDILIHHYFGVDLRVVWKAVRDELPDVIRVLRAAGIEHQDRDG